MLTVPILGKFGTGTLNDTAGVTAGIASDQIGYTLFCATSQALQVVADDVASVKPMLSVPDV